MPAKGKQNGKHTCMIGLFDSIQYKLGQSPLWRIRCQELGGPLNFYSFASGLGELQRLSRNWCSFTHKSNHYLLGEKKKKKALSISLQLLGNIQRLEQDLYKAAAIKYLCMYMYIKKNICVYREKMCNGAFVYLAITLPYFLFIYFLPWRKVTIYGSSLYQQ